MISLPGLLFAAASLTHPVPMSRAVTGSGLGSGGPQCCTITGCNCFFDDEFNGGAVNAANWLVVNDYSSGPGAGGTCFTSAATTVSGGYLQMQMSATPVANCPSPWYAASHSGSLPTSTYSASLLQTVQTFKPTATTTVTVEYRYKAAPSTVVGQWWDGWWFWAACQTPNLQSAYIQGNCDPGGGPIAEIDVNEWHQPWAATVSTWEAFSGTTNTFTATTTITDQTANFHVYTFVWSTTGGTFYLDHASPVTLTGGSIATAAFFILDTQLYCSAGGNSCIAGLPGTTQVDYVRITMP